MTDKTIKMTALERARKQLGMALVNLARARADLHLSNSGGIHRGNALAGLTEAREYVDKALIATRSTIEHTHCAEDEPIRSKGHEETRTRPPMSKP